jgi:hypothetical protein
MNRGFGDIENLNNLTSLMRVCQKPNWLTKRSCGGQVSSWVFSGNLLPHFKCISDIEISAMTYINSEEKAHCKSRREVLMIFRRLGSSE